MKKIKGLLLFGILTLLGIGCSFGAIPFYFDYFTDNGGLTSYNLHNSSNFSPCIYTRNGVSYSADLSTYSQSCNSSFNSNYLGFYVYYDTNGNKLAYWLNGSSNSRPGYLFVLSSNLPTEYITSAGNGAYSRILAGSDCLGSDIFQNGSFCTPNFIQLFTNNYYTISSLGNIYDSDYDGVHYYKGPVSPAVGLGYSFGFVTGSGWQNDGNHYYLNTGNGDFFTFRSVSFSGSNMSAFEGVLLMRLNNTSSVSDSSDYKLFALGVTGNVNDYSFIYSIYNCPSTAGKYYDCVFSEGGNINENFSYDFESSNPYSNLIYLLTNPGAVKLNNSYSSTNNTLSLTSQLNSNNGYISSTTYTITLNLVPTAGIDIIGGAPVDTGHLGSGSNSMAQSLWLMCLGPVYNTPDGLPPAICLNSDGSLKKKSDLDNCYAQYTFVGLDVTTEYFCSNGNFLEQMEPVLDGSGVFLVPCTGSDCSIHSLLTLDPNATGYSEDYFEDFLNTTGFLGKCPRTYDEKLVLWPKLITLLNGKDILLPINCAIAGFSHGKNSLNFGSGRHLVPNGPILNFEGDNRKALYLFFDVLISLGIVIFAGKIFYLFHK